MENNIQHLKVGSPVLNFIKASYPPRLLKVLLIAIGLISLGIVGVASQERTTINELIPQKNAEIKQYEASIDKACANQDSLKELDCHQRLLFSTKHLNLVSELKMLEAESNKSGMRMLWDNIGHFAYWFLIPLIILIVLPLWKFIKLAYRRVQRESPQMSAFQRYSLIIASLILVALVVIVLVLIL